MYRPFRFGVVIANALSRTAFVTLARRAEELGYATLLMPDRTITGLAPLTALAVAAEATTSLHVGSYVFCNDYRHPALLAKEVTTLDFLSDGRFELGLGAGVGPFDYQQLGLPFDTGDERVAQASPETTPSYSYWGSRQKNAFSCCAGGSGRALHSPRTQSTSLRSRYQREPRCQGIRRRWPAYSTHRYECRAGGGTST